MPDTINTLRAGRSLSIDAFRGLTFVAMIFVNEAAGVSGISPWLKHMPADADAMSFPDIVFPAFLFIVGMSIPFALDARMVKGDGFWALQRHIVSRALALVVMGLFMVNAEGGFNAQAMPMPIALWSLLFYAAVYLVWGALPAGGAGFVLVVRAAGVLLMLGLAASYRGGDGSAWMAPQWWGILGLIGWAYWLACELYLLARGRLVAVLGFLGLCVAYYAAAHRLAMPASLKWLFSQDAHAAHAQIVLAGVACALVFFDARRHGSNARRFTEGALLMVGLAAAGLVAWRWFPISKIHATPSWCLLSGALCVLVFGLLHAVVDVCRRTAWVRLVEPAAANPLVTYLLPFVVLAAMSLLGLQLPAVLRNGAVGLLWSAAYAALIVWIVSRLAGKGVKLRL